MLGGKHKGGAPMQNPNDAPLDPKDPDPKPPADGPTEPPADGASKGGQERARRLSPESRSNIARKGAAARWKLPQATHVGVLNLAGAKFECAVLDDGTRVLSEGSFMSGMGMYWSGYIAAKRRADADADPAAADLPMFMAYEKLKPFIDADLRALLAAPVKYITTTGGVGHGIKAEIIPKILGVWLQARDAGGLGKRQALIAMKADMMTRGLAQVAITALVDEATGFQYDRTRDALAEILEAFVNEELRKWVRTFPTEFYRQMFRLRGWPFMEGSTSRSPLVGKLTNNIVYQRLAPGVLQRLREKNPTLPSGRREHKHFQYLTEDVGDPKLREHLASVTDLMKVSDTWAGFIALLDRARPKHKPMPLFDREDDGEATAS
jgi:hypothetical protein